MEAELIKEHVVTSYPSAKFTLNISAEGESIVPDVKKDIAEIVLTESRSFIEKTEIQKNRVIFTGVSEFTVLYLAEDSSALNSLTVKIPFNHIRESEGVNPDDKFTEHYETIHSECTLLNSRKISLKSIISVNFMSYSDISLPVATKISSSEAEVKSEDAAFSRIVSAVEECFTVSDFLEIPPSAEPIDSILLSRASVKDTSFKTVTGKAVIKGTLSVFQLYLSEEGTLSHMQHDLPFTEIIDVPDLTEDDCPDFSFTIKSFSAESSAEEKAGRGFYVTADILFNATVFITERLSVISDSYIPGIDVSLASSLCKKCEILKTENLSLSIKSALSLPPEIPETNLLCPVEAKITDLNADVENGKITVTGTIEAKMLFIAEETSSVLAHIHHIPFSEVYDSPVKTPCIFIKGKITHTDYSFANQSKLDLRCFAELSITLSENTDSFRIINAVNVGDPINPERPSIIIYFVKSGDTLWDIAKKYNTTKEKIISANALENEDILNAGMRLLIPA